MQNVVKVFETRDAGQVHALDGVTFESAAKRVTCLVGPTGSGKSTLLRMTAGLETADQGEVLVGGGKPGDLIGQTGYLTQRHTLFPWMKVRDNIALPLAVRNIPRGERLDRIRIVCEQLGLQGKEDLYPYELSGGLQQRAVLGRLLATDSRLWLLDEPFAALDERTRHQLQELLLGLVSERGLSVLLVTHSIDEAVYLADRIVVLSAAPGKTVETADIGLPHPRNRIDPAYGSLMERIRTSIEAAL